MRTKERPAAILPLTTIRFAAAILVVLFHAEALTSSSPLSTYLHSLVSLGYASVSFFFMLSGYILAVVYLSRDRTIEVRSFYVSRFARIYPIYIVALALDLPHFLNVETRIFHQPASHAIDTVLASAALVQAWSRHLVGLNTASWSLSVECFFYLLFPWIGGAIWRMRRLKLAVSVFVCYFAGMFCVFYFLYLHPGSTVLQAYNPLFHLYVFMLGIQLAAIQRELERKPAASRQLKRLAPLLVCGIAIFWIVISFHHVSIPETVLQHGALAPVYGLLILALSSGNQAVDRLFSAGWLVLLGEASYSLYLLHVPVLTLGRVLVQGHGMAALFCGIAFCVGLSVISFQYLESPARKWILQKWKARSQETLLTSSLAE